MIDVEGEGEVKGGRGFKGDPGARVGIEGSLNDAGLAGAKRDEDGMNLDDQREVLISKVHMGLVYLGRED